MCFNWQDIIYASQMQNYELGMLFVSILVLVFCSFCDKINQTKNYIFLALICFVSVIAHYQLLLFVVSGYFGLFLYKMIKNDNEFKKCLFSFVLFLIILAPFFLIFIAPKSSSGITGWNCGPNQEFLFSTKNVTSFIDYILYTTKFYTSNSLVMLISMIGIETKIISINFIVSLILLFFVFMGVLFAFRSTKPVFNYVAIFTSVLFCVFGFLIIIQKLTLSPTRHYMLLIPVFIITICICIEKIKFILKFNTLPLVLSFLFTISFFLGFANKLNSRKNLFLNNKLEKILQDYKPNLLLTDINSFHNVYLKLYKTNSNIECDSIISKKISNNSWESTFYKIKKNDFDKNRLIFISNFSLPSNNSLLKLENIFNVKLKLIYRYQKTNSEEIDFSNKTKNGTNNMYINIYDF